MRSLFPAPMDFGMDYLTADTLRPEEVLSDQDQIDKLYEAINLVESFQQSLEAADLWEEM